CYGLAYWTARRVAEHSNAGRRGHQLMQDPPRLRPYLCSQRRYAREIAARSSETGDKSRRDWVVAGREDDRNGRRRRLCCYHRRRTVRGNHSYLALDQVGHQRRKSIILAVRPAILNRHVAALDIAGSVKPFTERAHKVRG